MIDCPRLLFYVRLIQRPFNLDILTATIRSKGVLRTVEIVERLLPIFLNSLAEFKTKGNKSHNDIMSSILLP